MNNDLISREALKKAFEEAHTNFELTFDINTYGDVINIIDNAPTVEYPFYKEAYQTGYEEGKNDRQKGEWIFDERGYFYCDQCGKYPNDQVTATDFCPKCGAKMKGGAKMERSEEE